MLQQSLSGGGYGANNPLSSVIGNLATQSGTAQMRNGSWGTGATGASYKDLGDLTKGPSCNPQEHKAMTEQQPDMAVLDALAASVDGKTASACTGKQQATSKGSASGGAANGTVSCVGNDGFNISTTTGAVAKLIMTREGWKNQAYWDVKGYSIGIGHFGAQAGQVISNQQVVNLFKSDIQERWNAALNQIKQLGVDDHCFFTHLVSVNFQLGTGWTSKFPSAWAAMKQGNFTQAIQQVQNSKWASQTPVRVQDFTRALKGMIGQTMSNGKKITLYIEHKIMQGLQEIRYAFAGGHDGGGGGDALPWCGGGMTDSNGGCA
jgi:lysozyme